MCFCASVYNSYIVLLYHCLKSPAKRQKGPQVIATMISPGSCLFIRKMDKIPVYGVTICLVIEMERGRGCCILMDKAA